MKRNPRKKKGRGKSKAYRARKYHKSRTSKHRARKYKILKGTMYLNPRRRSRRGLGKLLGGKGGLMMDALYILGGFLGARILGNFLKRFVKDETLSSVLVAGIASFLPFKFAMKDKLAIGAIVNAGLTVANKFLPAQIQNTLSMPIAATGMYGLGFTEVVDGYIPPEANVGGWLPAEADQTGQIPVEETGDTGEE